MGGSQLLSCKWDEWEGRDWHLFWVVDDLGWIYLMLSSSCVDLLWRFSCLLRPQGFVVDLAMNYSSYSFSSSNPKGPSAAA